MTIMPKLDVNAWLVVRVTVILLGVLGVNSFLPGPQSPFAGGSTALLFVFFCFGVIAMVLVVGVQAFNPRSASVWTKPDWHANPFTMKQPLQFFHMTGFYFLACGMAALVLTQVRHLVGLEPFIPLALGTGTLVGIKCCVALYRRKFIPRDSGTQ